MNPEQALQILVSAVNLAPLSMVDNTRVREAATVLIDHIMPNAKTGAAPGPGQMIGPRGPIPEVGEGCSENEQDCKKVKAEDRNTA